MPDRPATPPSSPLQGLAVRALGGDTTAFEQMHARLNPWLVRMFRDRLSPQGSAKAGVDQADDLAQRTWVGVWRAISERRYDPSRSAISTFIYAVAYNVWLQHLKQTQSRASLHEALANEQAGSGVGSAPPPPSLAGLVPEGGGNEAGVSEVLELVRACLRGEVVATKLTTDELDILRGISQGESDRALADRLGISPSTAHGRKKSALAKLRGYLTSRGV